MNLVYVALGGSLGAIARYIVSVSINLSVNRDLPYGTLFVNTTGSFAIGFLFAVFERTGLPADLKLLLVTGFLGAYTTFSSYSLETVNLALNGKFLLAASNFCLNNLLCLALTVIGIKAGRACFGG